MTYPQEPGVSDRAGRGAWAAAAAGGTPHPGLTPV